MQPNYTLPEDTEEMKACVHSTMIAKREKKYSVDNLDKPVRGADYYVNSTLVAKQPVTVRKVPSDIGDVVKEYPKGSNVGIIYSWVVRDGQVWWQMNWFSGKPQGWVKHSPELFDADIAEQTSQGKAIEVKKELERIEEEKNPFNQLAKGVSGVAEGFGSVGANFKYILLAVLVLAAVYVFFTFKKAM
jgi:hypothetical protein